jgi:hypothetical protein
MPIGAEIGIQRCCLLCHILSLVESASPWSVIFLTLFRLVPVSASVLILDEGTIGLRASSRLPSTIQFSFSFGIAWVDKKGLR